MRVCACVSLCVGVRAHAGLCSNHTNTHSLCCAKVSVQINKHVRSFEMQVGLTHKLRQIRHSSKFALDMLY